MSGRDSQGVSGGASEHGWQAPHLHLSETSHGEPGVRVQIDTLGTIETIDGSSTAPYSTDHAVGQRKVAWQGGEQGPRLPSTVIAGTGTPSGISRRRAGSRKRAGSQSNLRGSFSQTSLASNPLARTVSGSKVSRTRTATGGDRSGLPTPSGGVGRGSRRGARRGPRLSPLEAAPVPQMLGWDQLDRLATQLGVTPMGRASPDVDGSTQGGLSLGRGMAPGLGSLPVSEPGSARASTSGAPGGSGLYSRPSGDFGG